MLFLFSGLLLKIKKMTGFFTNKMKKTFTIGVFLFSLIFSGTSVFALSNFFDLDFWKGYAQNMSNQPQGTEWEWELDDDGYLKILTSGATYNFSSYVIHENSLDSELVENYQSGNGVDWLWTDSNAKLLETYLFGLPDDNYFIQFYNGTSYGDQIAVGYILLNADNGSFTPLSSAVNGSYLWSDWCGSDAGTLIETTPINLCDVGTPGTVYFDGSKWSWDCIDGVVSQSCRAYLATTQPVDGTCGAWDGETFNTWPPLTELCELKTSLVVPSMVETLNGYTWTCSGINGGTSDYCSGNKTSPPLMPELPAGSLDDCSGLSILEGLVCKMGNTLKTIFLPSSEKLNELNQTINKMSSKFPFSYISKATETFNDLKGNITETSLLELSIMESEKSSIDFSTIAFFDYIKKLTTILIIIVFSFWLIRFIKHIF